MRVAVIGAGPAGLTAAYKLAQAGVSTDVFEAGPHVGGLARSIDLWGQRVDLGPHRFFSNDRRVNALWLEVIGRDYAMVNRLTRIYYRQRFFHYPLQAMDALSKLGVLTATQCVSSYALQKLRPKNSQADATMEEWVTSRFGKKLYEIFFKTYSEKLWGIPCNALDADFAAQRIKGLSLFEAIKNAVQQGRGNRHATLVDKFAYPRHGSGAVYEKMAQAFTQAGGTLHLQRPVDAVTTTLHNNQPRADGIRFADGTTLAYDHIISTMPLSLMVSRLQAPAPVLEAAQQLRFRNTLLVYLHVAGANLFPDQWVYVHDERLHCGRITNFRNWEPELYGSSPNTIIAMEYWCYDDDPRWQATEPELVALATEEFKKSGLAQGQVQILNGHVERIRRCYPVYSRGYKEPLAKVVDYLKTVQNLTVIGRYGAFKYNNQDHSILMGLFAAENIAAGKSHDLWGINTDYGYQEAARITETGLEAVPS